MKKVLPFIVVVFFMFLLVFGFLSRTTLNNFISEKMKEQADNETTLSVEELINSKYNYLENRQNYEYTLLEFGSTGCTICKQMEGELEKIRISNSTKIKVVFLNTIHPENQNMVKYFGIAAIPMQVLLDKSGKEFFKNYGFISAEDLIAKTVENAAK